MSRKTLYLIPVLAMFLLPAIARAQFEAGNWDLTLGGSGSNDRDFRTGNFAVNAGLGYFLTKEIELGVRQTFSWGDGGSTWGASTVGFADWNFDMDRWVPFVGASIGYSYGSPSPDAWSAGPEGGVKYFLNSTTYVYGEVQYLFDIQNDISNGAWFYTAGIGVQF